MQKNRMKKSGEEGAVIVEATIALPVFMFAIVTLLSIINICLAQAKMGVFVNESAKELSKIAYVLEAAGLNEKQAGTAESGAKGKAEVTDVLNGNKSIFTAMGDIISETELQKSMGSMLLNEGVEGIKTALVNVVLKNMEEERLTNGYLSGKAYEQELGIQNVSFAKSKFSIDGKGDIRVVAEYDIQVMKLLGIDIKFHFVQSAATKSW